VGIPNEYGFVIPRITALGLRLQIRSILIQDFKIRTNGGGSS
jgi:hypothetical protein